MNATEVMETILEHGKKTADGSSKEIGSLAIGDFAAQGDVNIWRLGSLPSGLKRIEKPSRQLAPGTTKGSRHMIAEADMKHCEFYELPNANEIQGPVIKMNEPTTIDHPEHGNHVWPADVVLITYQRAFAEELKRTLD